tara:strand:- start:1262 stop:1633 length:372 start_codon:yes stop_codon:yes gene_type:complete
MAHFSQLNDSNEVIAVNVIADADCLDGDGNESEAVGIAFCQSLWGADTTWKQTSYNETIRKNFGTVGTTYDSTRDAFIPIKLWNSWVLNESTCKWKAPVDEPDNENAYMWNEETTSWDILTKE